MEKDLLVNTVVEATKYSTVTSDLYKMLTNTSKTYQSKNSEGALNMPSQQTLLEYN